jgi:hypothetical protein
VTTPVFDLTAPNSTATGTTVVVLVNRIFALQYQLSTATTSAAAASGLSTGAKAGLGAGVAALAAIIGIVIFLVKHHKRTPPTQASALAPPENMQYAPAAGASELHSTPVSNIAAPLSYVFKPGFMEADSTPLETSPHHGYVEVDGAVQPARHELVS